MIALALTFSLAHAQTAIEAVEMIDRAHREVRALGDTKKEDTCWDCPLGEPEICSRQDVCRAYAPRGNRAELLGGLPNYQKEACEPGADDAQLKSLENFDALVKKRHAEKAFATASRRALESGDATEAAQPLPEKIRKTWLELQAVLPKPAAAEENPRLKTIFADVRRKVAAALGRRDAALATAVKKVELAEAPASACDEPNVYLQEGTLYVCPRMRGLPEATLTLLMARELGRAVGPCPPALAAVSACLNGPGAACNEDAQASWVASQVLADDLPETTMDARRRAFESVGFFAAHACKLETDGTCRPELSAGATFAQATDALFSNPIVRAKLGCPKTAVKHCD